MQVRQLHSWQVTIPEALDIQRRLAAQVSRRSPSAEGRSQAPASVRYVAGVDLSPPDAQGVVRGAAVLVGYPDLAPVEVQVAEGRPHFPYVPGLLSFRESPVLLQALERLHHDPDIILVDGHGYAHPRRFGIACHIGVLVDRPTIGCAKSRLVGSEGTLALEAGSCADLRDQGEVVGTVVRTREGVAPIYVTIGHRVDLPTAVRWVLACCKGYRIPEPTRLAHLAAAGRLQPDLSPSSSSELALSEGLRTPSESLPKGQALSKGPAPSSFLLPLSAGEEGDTGGEVSGAPALRPAQEAGTISLDQGRLL